jgi:hypothetical protein
MSKPGGMRKNAHTAREPAASKRWETAMHSEMERTAQALAQRDQSQASYERRKDLQDRKTNNTTTSISFGHEKVGHIIILVTGSFLNLSSQPLHDTTSANLLPCID